MHSLHAEFELENVSVMSETAAACIHYIDNQPTLVLMQIEAGSYADIYELCAALSACTNAPSGFECRPGADGHIVCRANEIWRPYVNTDESTSALCEMLWNILGYDTCTGYADAYEHRAKSLPRYSAWFDAITEFAPPTVEILSQQSLSTGGSLAQSVYGCRRTALLALRHLDAATVRAYCDVLDLAAQGRRLRLYVNDTFAAEAFMDMGGDTDPLPQRMYQGCEAYAASLPLLLCEEG